MPNADPARVVAAALLALLLMLTGPTGASLAAPGIQPATSPLASAPGAPVSGRGARVRRRAGAQRGAPKRSVVTKIVNRIPDAVRVVIAILTLLAGALGLAAVRERRLSRRSKREALIDPLTGIANRLAFERRLSEEWKRARRYRRPLGLVLLDLDNFKQVNDLLGHVAGDRVLRKVADTIAGRVRETDFPARLGGDEFVVLCPEIDERGLRELAGSLRVALQAASVRASAGYAQLDYKHESAEQLVARADRSMYGDKQRGRAARERWLVAV